MKTNYYLRDILEILCPKAITSIMKKLLFFFLLATTLPVNAQTEVNAFLTGTQEGVTYYLPETKVNISFEAICIKRTPGEFSRYAERYLRVKDAIKEANVEWKLTGTSVELTGQPSPEKMFTIKLNGSKASNITLDKQGIIASINTDVATEEEEVAVAGTDVPDKKPGEDAGKYMTEEMLHATSTAKLAELTAKEIYSIRESKLAITRGQAENMPKDGYAIELILDELDKQEQALTELFVGRTDTITQSKCITVKPGEKCDTTKAVLIRFSRKLGFLDKENLAGEPVYYNLRDLKSVKLPTAEEMAKIKPLKKEGICYNIPGKAELEIYTGSKKILKEEIPVAQLGTTEILSKSLFNKSNTTIVVFDTATGGIISIEKR